MKKSDIEVTYVNHCGSDLSVVNAARVSFHKESDMVWKSREPTEEDRKNNPFPEYPIERIEYYGLDDKDEKLIQYLARNKHFSPFNHSFITLRVKAPIFVARQLVKHKFMPWNEVSRRYVDEEPEFYFPDKWRARAENVKQGSSDDRCEAMYEEFDDELFGPSPSAAECVEWGIEEALRSYEMVLKHGAAPEQARMVLPQNMMTEWWWSGTLGAYADMLKLRLDPHTQYESRIVAQKAYVMIKELFPISIKALLND